MLQRWTVGLRRNTRIARGSKSRDRVLKTPDASNSCQPIRGDDGSIRGPDCIVFMVEIHVGLGFQISPLSSLFPLLSECHRL